MICDSEPSDIQVFLNAGFHDEKCSFGITKKSGYRPSSDFNFEFVAEVICANSLHSGYMVQVTSERSHATNPSQCTRYFTGITSTMLHVCNTIIQALLLYFGKYESEM